MPVPPGKEMMLLLCVQVFERWMEWEPEEQAWNSYIKMELRYKELDRARGIYERFVQVKITAQNIHFTVLDGR